MSEFLAEASVVIVPDVSKFRATLIAELTKATKGIAVPIPVVAQAKVAQTVVQSNKAAAASAQQAATATKELAATRTKQIISDRQAAAAEANLAEAQRLTAAAQQRLTVVETAGERSTTKVAAARAQLRAANVALTASQKAVDAALLEGAEAAQANAVATLRSAVALRANAIAAEASAAATIVEGRATAKATKDHERFTRGLEAETLALAGIRGATLAASSGFLLGAAAVTVTAKAVEEANAEIEAAARVQKVFGDAAVELEHHAHDLADSFGLSATEALRFEGQIGNILTVSKVASDQVPELSENLVKLAADMAAFSNVPLPLVLKAISLGLVGNSRGLRQFGIELNAAAVNQRALAESGKKNTDELTRAERVQARINILFDQTILQQGAAQRRSEGLAQGSRVLKAELANLGASIGTKLIPFLTDLVQDGKDVIGVLRGIDGAATDLGEHLDKLTGGGGKKKGFFSDLKDFATSSLPAQIQRAKKAFTDLKDQITGAGDSLDKFERADTSLKELHDAAVRAFNEKQLALFDDRLQAIIFHTRQIAVEATRISFRASTNQLATLEDKLVGVKIAGGDAAAQLANLARQEAVARRQVAAAQAEVSLTGGRSPAAVERLRESRRGLLDIIEQERDLRQQQADAAEKAARDIAQAIEDAQQRVQQLLDEADQAALDLIERLGRPFDVRQLRVQATASLQDDLAFQRDLQSLLKRQIAIAASTINDAKLRAQTIHDLTVALVRSEIEEKQLKAQVAKNRQARRAAAFDRAAESIDLDIQLAQTEKNRRAEIRARQRRIALDQERLKAVRGDIIATKRLRNDIAEQRAAIKELKKELDKRNDAEKQLEFAFLQRQAGFAANLLSNLIPTAALAGTVGGTVASTNTPIPPANFAQAAHTRRGVRGDVASATQTQTAQRGASSSQMATLIHIQRGMLGVLTRLVNQRTHPEAHGQRVQQATSMDTTYGV